LIFTGPRPSVRGVTLVLDKPGMRPDNRTVLDRNYHARLWISLAIVWACVPLYLVAMRLLPVRRKTK